MIIIDILYSIYNSPLHLWNVAEDVDCVADPEHALSIRGLYCEAGFTMINLLLYTQIPIYMQYADIRDKCISLADSSSHV